MADHKYAAVPIRVLVAVATCPGCGVEATSEVFSPERLDTYPKPQDMADAAAALFTTYVSRGSCFDGWSRVGDLEVCGKCVARAKAAVIRG